MQGSIKAPFIMRYNMLLDIALYIYIAGIVGTSLYHLWGFSQGVKILRSGSSAIFIGLNTIKDIIFSVLWPVDLVILVLQMFVAKGTLDDFNQRLSEYNGLDDYDEED